MKRVLATMLCLATAPVAMAGEWVFVTITSDDSKEAHVIAYDRETITNHDGDINVWFAWINSIPTLKYDLVLDLWQIDCNQKRRKTLQRSFYLRGKHLHSSSHNKEEWKYAIPGSVGDTLIEFSCKKLDIGITTKTGSLVELVKKGKELIKEQASQKENAF